MSNTNIDIGYGELMHPTHEGVVIDASERWTASEETQRQFFDVAYGAGNFTVAAASEAEAADIAVEQRSQVMGELALPLVFPVDETRQQHLEKLHPKGVPDIIVAANPSGLPIARTARSERVQPADRNQLKLFSWIVHGGTGKIMYRMHSDN